MEFGIEFVYFNVGYVIVGVMLEQVLGELWEVLIECEVMMLLGIDEFGFGVLGLQDQIDQFCGYCDGFFGNFVVMVGFDVDNLFVLGLVGMMYMLLVDYVFYLQVYMDGGCGVDMEFFSQDSWDILYNVLFEVGYLMGWGLGMDELQYFGFNMMWIMYMVIVFEQQIGVVIVMNCVCIDYVGLFFWQVVSMD